jgi:endoglucanase
VEMHRPDGVPDAVEQVRHGVLQVLAQVHSIGHPIMGIIEPTLRQYTHLGDAASNTDGRVYSDELGVNEMNASYSGKPDDRWAFTTKRPGLEYGAAAALAAASQTLKGWDDPLAKECLDTAVKLWNDEHAHPTPESNRAFGVPGMSTVVEWRAALELMIATNGGAEYKKRVLELFPTVRQNMAFGGWTAVFALPYMDEDFKNQLEESVKAYKAELDTELAKTPFGVPPSMGTWGGSSQVAGFGASMYFLHKAFPDVVGPEYTLRAANYLLGTHPVSSTSYISSVGTVSKMKAYGNNRADNTFIPGGMIPGYIVIKPDFPECIDDFGFLWFENEYTISAAAKWVLEANAAEALVK